MKFSLPGKVVCFVYAKLSTHKPRHLHHLEAQRVVSNVRVWDLMSIKEQDASLSTMLSDYLTALHPVVHVSIVRPRPQPQKRLLVFTFDRTLSLVRKSIICLIS